METILTHSTCTRRQALKVAMGALTLPMVTGLGACAPDRTDEFIGNWAVVTNGVVFADALIFVIADDGSWAEYEALGGQLTGTLYDSQIVAQGTWTVSGDTITLERTDVADTRYVFKISDDGSTLKSMADGEDVVLQRVQSQSSGQSSN